MNIENHTTLQDRLLALLLLHPSYLYIESAFDHSPAGDAQTSERRGLINHDTHAEGGQKSKDQGQG